ncbi:tRNA (N6-threonylcarbamoyladenosine(37)-N6)-methyltransferase TrmO [Pseudidiomarina sediminum]|uniref:tRNA (N6-threonylcarbamoyladenosine(37)-N6)-methyltransferase TrmO n=1 Tax=Pseudidiomarina sediminum TaxID=431675 RepID=UPI001C97C751|nr:tRNA (N6-threonylcarbamoyladenosine(37)-N6)-methyltransferase TrmO [Pseudidiomarina sediminum]MBY6063263.1 tRNA (N6-threonylcarbamoyladenosine(37)-N6)-methyltransferase TrmO [Pseudidiomarina sediminum]
MQHVIQAIGTIHSPYPQKFAIPRQPGLVTAATAQIELTDTYGHPDTTRGLQGFSHIWVSFLFHQNLAQGWQALVRPPRLGGNEKVGVFASRSTFRPNGIGLSVVKLLSIEQGNGGTLLHVQGGDWVDGTPVLDIKPYLPYVDAVPDALGGYASSAPDAAMTVHFSAQAQQQLTHLGDQYPQLALLIEQVLQQDPRPAYHKGKSSDKVYGMQLFDLNIQWQVRDHENHVVNISKGF